LSALAAIFTKAPSAPSKRLTLVACILGTAMVFIDGTVLNVALPAIQKDLDAGLADQQWIVEAFLLTLSSLLLVGGSLDDIFERRSVFAAGVAGFGAMSLLCAVAPSVEVLIAARALQGAAGALLVPSTLAIIMAVFPTAERGAAIGTWTAWAGVATVIGPLGGGVLVQAASWRWIFVLNLPLALVTLWLIGRAIPRMEPPERGARVDWLGGLLGFIGLGGLIVALIEQPQRGWGDPIVWGGALLGVAALVAFVVHERRTAEPMLPLGLFRSRNFAVGNIGTLTLYAGLSGALFFLAIYLQQVGGYSPVAAGAAFLPFTVLMFLLSKRMGALADRIGPRLFMGLGPIVAGLGLLLFLRVDQSPSYATEILPAVLIFGFGMSATVAPLTATVLGAVDERYTGVASGVNNAISRVAGLLAIALLGAFVAAAFSHSVDDALAGRRLSPAASAAVAEAKDRSLSVAPADSVPAAERPRVRAALADSSESAFHLGIAIAGLLVIGGGVASLFGIANPRREVACESCPGGALVGASEDLARVPERAPEPAAA
jgi:EmrB/QacA subfamily drug resistance transporter